MTSFTNVTQKIFQASQGQQLVDVVDYAATISPGPIGAAVILVDLLTGKQVATSGFIPEDLLFGGTISGSLPTLSDNLVMPDQPLYLQVQLWTYWISFTGTKLEQKVDLQGIALPGGGGGGGGSGGTVVPLPLIIAGVAGVGLLAAGIYLLKRH